MKIFDFVKTSAKHEYVVQAWRELLKGEKQKKQRDGKEQAPSIQEAS